MVFKTTLRGTAQRLKNTKRVPVACDCWFTSTGRTIPKLFCYEDEYGVRHTVDEIQVIKSERRKVSGSSIMVYDCEVMLHEHQCPMQLYYCLTEGTWGEPNCFPRVRKQRFVRRRK